MIAYVTSVGEPTTDLCVWSLQRNGFDVHVLNNGSSLASKLHDIYASADDDFLRVDADIIVNQNMTPKKLEILGNDDDIWWWQFVTFDWFKMDTNHSMSFIKKEALPTLRNNIDRFLDSIRPETDCSRIDEFYNPRRFATYDSEIMGIHGYGIKDMKPVMKLKANRGQSHLYDFELTKRMNEL